VRVGVKILHIYLPLKMSANLYTVALRDNLIHRIEPNHTTHAESITTLHKVRPSQRSFSQNIQMAQKVFLLAALVLKFTQITWNM